MKIHRQNFMVPINNFAKFINDFMQVYLLSTCTYRHNETQFWTKECKQGNYYIPYH